MKPILSTVVCTYNRFEQLRKTLETLIQQTLSPDQYEIVVVNNGSTDGTENIVREFAQKRVWPEIIHIVEMRQGLGYARNAGWKQSRGEYVGFLDDDAKADPQWLQLALECFEKVIPPPLEIGGPVFPEYAGEKPYWFKEEYELRTWGNQPRFLDQRESFSGSNMFFKRKVIEECGGFDERVGMRGNRISLGEETSLVERIWEKYGKETVIYYSPFLRVYHEVPVNKMSILYQMKRAFATGQGYYQRKGPIRPRKRIMLIFEHLLEVIVKSFLGLGQRNRYPTRQNWLWECYTPVAINLGKLLGCMKIFIQLRHRNV